MRENALIKINPFIYLNESLNKCYFNTSSKRFKRLNPLSYIIIRIKLTPFF